MLGGEVAAEEFGLFEDGLGGLFLFVWRVAVFSEDAFDHGAELGLNALFLRPVDGSVFADGVDEFAGDGFQRVVAKDFDGAVADFESIVEG